MRREWIVRANPETGEVDPGALESVAADAATVARMVGGVVQIGVKRVEERGEFFTIGAMVEWQSYAPAERVAAPDPGEEDGEDGIPVAVEEPEPVGVTE